MGLITFSHLEASLLKQRSDLYERMVCEDPLSTSQEENKNKSVTKLRLVSSVLSLCRGFKDEWRYLDWRDQRSSSRTIGFRVEGTYQDNQAKKDFKSVRTGQDVLDVLTKFIKNGNAKVGREVKES